MKSCAKCIHQKSDERLVRDTGLVEDDLASARAASAAISLGHRSVGFEQLVRWVSGLTAIVIQAMVESGKKRRRL